jgi:tetratricopeptide (TPR) repeat protein
LLAALLWVIADPVQARPERQFASEIEPAGQAQPQGNQARAELPAKQIEVDLARGDSDAARRLVPGLLAQPRLSGETMLRIGSKLAERDLDLEASRVFERCVHDFPQLFEGYYDLSFADLALGRYSEALAVLANAPRASHQDEIALTYLRGKIEAAMGKNAAAERDLSAAFRAVPRQENYALDLGLHYIRTQQYRQALAVFKQASALNKDSPFLQLGLALAQFLAGLNAESVETCRAALALHPDFSPARVMMAFALYMQGNTAAAEKTAAEGLRNPNLFPYLYYIHAVSLIKLQSRNYDLMLKDLNTALGAIPQCSLCYVAMSRVYEKRGERKIAIADLEKAVGLDQNLADAWYRLAALYSQVGQPDAARQARQRFEKLKENKTDRETEILRDVFSNSLGAGSRH